MSFLLDTSCLAEALRASPAPAFVRRLSQVPTRDRWTSVITVSQLLLAARLQQDPRLMQNVVSLVAAIRVAPYDLAAAQSFAKFRSSLSAEAETDDVMIASIAVSREMTLVTRRAELFGGYPGLRIEDWTLG